MKKLIMTMALFAALLIGAKSFAQEGLSFGVKAGANLSSMSGDMFDDFKSKVGFQVGVTVEYGFTENLFLGSGLEFTTKGAKHKIEAGSVTTKTTFNPMYLQLPVHIGYKFEVADNIKLLVELGPYVGFGVGGKTKIKIDGTNVVDGNRSTDIFNKDNDITRFDFGVGGAIGAEFGAIAVKIGYDLGLMNMYTGDLDISNKTRNAFLTLGYKF